MTINFYCRIWTKNNPTVNLTHAEFNGLDFKTLHREDGPAIEFINSDIGWWYENGLRHRENGPAIEYTTGEQQWWINDKRHRLDGPAIITQYGNHEWWVNNKVLQTQDVENWIEENNINLSSEEGQMAFKLRWC